MKNPSHSLLKRIATVELVLFDVDGTMTDGGMWLSERGGEMKCYDVKDGLGIVLLRAAGIRTGIVSARISAVTTKRAKELKVDVLIQGMANKADALPRLKKKTGISAERIVFMGDDLNDLPLLERVGVSAAPSDASSEVLLFVDYICSKPGGHGAVRELCELVLHARGLQPRQALDKLLHR